MNKNYSKKEELMRKIKEFDSKYFNDDQKIIALKILENAPEKEIQTYYDFIIMKRKTGFGFDYSPEVAKGRLITLREDKNRRINVEDKIEENENKLIIGDNYNALKSLLITHKEKIDVIYIDPPYNTESAKKDGNQSSKKGDPSKFIYKDKFGRGGWLNMMKARLTLAQDLLSKNGVIFVSIDDSEQAYLKVLMDDIFGEENLDTLIWRKIIDGSSSGGTMKKINNFRKDHEYILIGYKDKNSFKTNKYYELPNFKNDYKNPDNDYRGPYKAGSISMKGGKNSSKYYEVTTPSGRKISRVWRVTQEKMQELIKDNRIYFGKNGDSVPSLKIFINEEREVTPTSIFENLGTTFSANNYLETIINDRSFQTTKPLELIKRILQVSTNKHSLIFDFFAGSGTTGHAVLELNREDDGNRKFILCTNDENKIAHKITYERLYRIIKGKTTQEKKEFKWLEANKPYKDEKLRVIQIDDSVKISLDENISESIYEDAKQGLKLLDKNYNKKDISFYYDLAALNPLKYEDDKLKEKKCD